MQEGNKLRTVLLIRKEASGVTHILKMSYHMCGLTDICERNLSSKKKPGLIAKIMEK
jgi:hypothetical protein